MKNFIEVTKSGNKKMLINVNKIIAVEELQPKLDKDKNIHCQIEFLSVKAGESFHVNTEETYQQIKELIEKAV